MARIAGVPACHEGTLGLRDPTQGGFGRPFVFTVLDGCRSLTRIYTRFHGRDRRDKPWKRLPDLEPRRSMKGSTNAR
jgi:hypothetical protein